MIKLRQNSPGHWTLRAGAGLLIALAVLYIPTKMSIGRIGDFTSAYELIVAAMALNLVLGYTGLISLGHAAFFGMGGYTTAVLVKEHGWSPGWTFFAAAALTFVVGCLIALPALRIKGIYLALVTLALAVLFPTLIRWKRLSWLTNGSMGFDSVRYDQLPNWPILGELKGRDGRAVFAYWLAVIILVITFLVCRGIVKSRVGRSLVAIRDNETAAAVMGVNLAVPKTLVFGVSAGLCALAGSLSTLRTGVITPDGTYVTLLGSIVFLLVMVVGGAGTLSGPIVGGIAYMLLDTYTREAGAKNEGPVGWLFGWADTSPATIILSVSLIILMFIAPYGLVGLFRKLSRKVLVVVPTPVGTGERATGRPAARPELTPTTDPEGDNP